MTADHRLARREALEAVEWVEAESGPGMVDGMCPWCHGWEPNHDLNCQRQEALAASPPERSGLDIIRRLVKWGTDPDLPDEWRTEITDEGFEVLRLIVKDAARLSSGGEDTPA